MLCACAYLSRELFYSSVTLRPFLPAISLPFWKVLARGKHEVAFFYAYPFAKVLDFLVGPSGLEPPTSCLSGTRSNLLSYEPMWLVWIFTLGFS